MRAAGCFYKNKDGKEYYNVVFSEEILHFIPQLRGLVFIQKENPIEVRKENSPTMVIECFKPKDE